MKHPMVQACFRDAIGDYHDYPRAWVTSQAFMQLSIPSVPEKGEVKGLENDGKSTRRATLVNL